MNAAIPHFPLDERLLIKPKPEPKREGNWQKTTRKTIYTLNIGDYAPEICFLTYPLIKEYASKIGADFKVIKDRKFPEWPVTYEKLQIYELAKQDGNDWSIYIDSDALVAPDFFDITDHLSKDTICHNWKDMAGIRWRYDQYFRRDGRHIGSANWFTVASDWCLDLWKPLDDLTPEQAFSNIHPANHERAFESHHLIDDYTLSRNIARYRLKFTTVTDICSGLGWKRADGSGISPFLNHFYDLTTEEKLDRLLRILSGPLGITIQDPEHPQIAMGMGLQLMPIEVYQNLRDKWGLDS